jgi:hypothetical protein
MRKEEGLLPTLMGLCLEPGRIHQFESRMTLMNLNTLDFTVMRRIEKGSTSGEQVVN